MIEKIFFISDLLFPMWWVGLMVILMKKGLISWKAWGIASTFCVTQAYLVAKFVGWNIGGYLLFFIASIPSIIVDEAQKNEYAFSDQVNYWFWILPPIILIVIPMIVLYFLSQSNNK